MLLRNSAAVGTRYGHEVVVRSVERLGASTGRSPAWCLDRVRLGGARATLPRLKPVAMGVFSRGFPPVGPVTRLNWGAPGSAATRRRPSASPLNMIQKSGLSHIATSRC